MATHSEGALNHTHLHSPLVLRISRLPSGRYNRGKKNILVAVA